MRTPPGTWAPCHKSATYFADLAEDEPSRKLSRWYFCDEHAFDHVNQQSRPIAEAEEGEKDGS